MGSTKPAKPMQHSPTNCFLISGWPALVVFLVVFTFANQPKSALAQANHVLFVEQLPKPGKVKILVKNDLLILFDSASGKEHKGRIRAFTDSSIYIVNGSEILIRNIGYIRKPDGGKLLLKALGWSMLPFSALFLADAVSPEPELHPHIHGIALGTAAAGTFLVTRKMGTQHRGPKTGWRIRIKKLG